MGRVRGGRIVRLEVDRGSSDSLHRQLYEQLRRRILDGQLASGSRMPSTRALAADLGIARSTILLAFAQLRAEGYIEGVTGSGTRVCAVIPDALLTSARVANAPRPVNRRPVRLSARGESLGQVPGPRDGLIGHGPCAFRAGVPAVDVFPLDIWTRLVARRLKRTAPRHLSYAGSRGHPPLRRAVAEYVTAARGVRCTEEQVIIVAGTQQAIDLCARMLLDPGDVAWVEDPGYHGARGAFIAAGAEVVDVPVDDEGMNIAHARLHARPARMTFVTPSRQLPLGRTMTLRRRLELLRCAAETDAWIVEDDYDSEFRYATRPLAALQGLDTNERVLYTGTFSKVMFPSLRLGYLIVPEPLVDAMARARHFADYHSPYLEQAVMADFMEGGHFERHIRRMRVIYAERQALLVEEAARHLDGWLRVPAADSGMLLNGWLAPGVDDARVAEVAERYGVHVTPISPFARTCATPPGLMLGYAGVDEPGIRIGVERLARVGEMFSQPRRW